jgi:hypothetical protein
VTASGMQVMLGRAACIYVCVDAFSHLHIALAFGDKAGPGVWYDGASGLELGEMVRNAHVVKYEHKCHKLISYQHS